MSIIICSTLETAELSAKNTSCEYNGKHHLGPCTLRYSQYADYGDQSFNRPSIIASQSEDSGSYAGSIASVSEVSPADYEESHSDDASEEQEYEGNRSVSGRSQAEYAGNHSNSGSPREDYRWGNADMPQRDEYGGYNEGRSDAGSAHEGSYAYGGGGESGSIAGNSYGGGNEGGSVGGGSAGYGSFSDWAKANIMNETLRESDACNSA